MQTSTQHNPSPRPCSFREVQDKLTALLGSEKVLKADLKTKQSGSHEEVELSLEISGGFELKFQRTVHRLIDIDISEDTELTVDLRDARKLENYHAHKRYVRFPLLDTSDPAELIEGLNLQNYLLRISGHLLRSGWEKLISPPRMAVDDELPESL